ncbi:nuc-1, partial [Pristionchus pacificus]|uniref:Nuc-1 n=1 Tax=Pristionchus pacificus TaxID=54126 RepID=A0A2A6CN09_PRIPA
RLFAFFSTYFHSVTLLILPKSMVVRLFFSLAIFRSVAAISCQNQYNFDVPWFASYKLPKQNGEPADSADGYGFYYLDSTSKSTLKPSPVSLKMQHNAIGYTLEPYYDRMDDEDVLHVFYNDEPAINGTEIKNAGHVSEDSTSVKKGHTKGVLLFDKDSGSGIWLVHSVPKFPQADKYVYPETGTKFGQQFLCLTLDTATLAQLGTVLYYNHPDIYSYRLPQWAEEIAPDLVQVLNKKYNKDPDNTNLRQPIAVKGAENTKMEVFAKTHLFNDDLWAAAVAPVYGPLEVETWRNDQVHLIPTDCNSTTPVYDGQEIKVGGSAQFKYTHDHSKYARTLDATRDKVVCIGDINRMTSQYVRGGGTVCIFDDELWKAYDTIKEIPSCPPDEENH